ncbi:MAG: hypothetical protein WCA37_06170 [Terracidiphilus sp.]
MMYFRKWSLPAAVTVLGGCILAAQSPSTVPPGQPANRIQDGGGGGLLIDSLFIPPIAREPFDLTLATEWVRLLANQGTLTLVNERRIVRDSRGRIYQERWLLVPKGSSVKSTMDRFQITDPDQQTWYNCHTATKVCDLFVYSLKTTDRYGAAVTASGPLPNGIGYRQTDDLGIQTVAGMDAHGYRETTTINPGVMGNDKQMLGIREFWYSDQLGISLRSVLDTPQTGRQVFTVKEITTSEPEPSFFAVPADYKVIDRRNDPE